MSTPVTLHVDAVPYQGEDDDGWPINGNQVTGRVKRGEKVLHTKTVITGNTIESVSDVKDQVGLEIEIWAVKNTDFTPAADTLPS